MKINRFVSKKLTQINNDLKEASGTNTIVSQKELRGALKGASELDRAVIGKFTEMSQTFFSDQKRLTHKSLDAALGEALSLLSMRDTKEISTDPKKQLKSVLDELDNVLALRSNLNDGLIPATSTLGDPSSLTKSASFVDEKSLSAPFNFAFGKASVKSDKNNVGFLTLSVNVGTSDAAGESPYGDVPVMPGTRVLIQTRNRSNGRFRTLGEFKPKENDFNIRLSVPMNIRDVRIFAVSDEGELLRNPVETHVPAEVRESAETLCKESSVGGGGYSSYAGSSRY